MKCTCNRTKDVYIQKSRNVWMPVGQLEDDFPFYHKKHCQMFKVYQHIENCFHGNSQQIG